MVGRERVVIVGAGAAGSAAAVALKRGAPEIDVVVVGAEEGAPYNRTTVNKGLLTGAVGVHEIGLPDLDDSGIAWRIGRSVRSVDPGAGAIELEDGTRLSGDAFVLAGGADPRPLPAPIDPAVADRVLTLRTATDALRLRALLGPRADRVVVAGAGLLGSETAGSLRALGVGVTLVDPAVRPLARHMGDAVADWVRAQHLGADVDVRTGTSVIAVDAAAPGGADDRVVVTLDDGTTVPATALVACLGVVPATGWLRDSGIPLSDGVPVDAAMRVIGCPGWYAVGDLAAVPGPDGARHRVEHWGAALAQGRAAAGTVLAGFGRSELDGDAPRAEVSSYSTYVHGTKLTIVGWASAAVAESVVHGAVGERRFTIALLDGRRRIVAVVGVGGARVANRLRDLVAQRAGIAEIDAALEGVA